MIARILRALALRRTQREIERNIALIHAPARKARSLSAHRGKRTEHHNRVKRAREIGL